MLVIVPHEERFYVNTNHGCGLVIAVESSRDENYIWTVVNQKDGKIRHYQSTQLHYTQNMTEEINISNEKPIFPSDKLID
jgi:hypothetical protein